MKKFKKLLLALLPVTAIAIATPIALTSCSSTAVDAYEITNDNFEAEFAKNNFKNLLSDSSKETEVITSKVNEIKGAGYNGAKDLIMTLNYLSWKSMVMDDYKEVKSLITMNGYSENNSNGEKKVNLDFTLNLRWKSTGTSNNNNLPEKEILVPLNFEMNNNVVDLKNGTLVTKFNSADDIYVGNEKAKIGDQVAKNYIDESMINFLTNTSPTKPGSKERNNESVDKPLNFENLIRGYITHKTITLHKGSGWGDTNWKYEEGKLKITAVKKSNAQKNTSTDTDNTIYENESNDEIKRKITDRLNSLIEMNDVSSGNKVVVSEVSAEAYATGNQVKKFKASLSTSNTTFIKQSDFIDIEISNATSSSGKKN